MTSKHTKPLQDPTMMGSHVPSSILEGRNFIPARSSSYTSQSMVSIGKVLRILWLEIVSPAFSLCKCHLAKPGSEIRDRHRLHTHFNRINDLIGSLDNTSMMISSGSGHSIADLGVALVSDGAEGDEEGGRRRLLEGLGGAREVGRQGGRGSGSGRLIADLGVAIVDGDSDEGGDGEGGRQRLLAGRDGAREGGRQGGRASGSGRLIADLGVAVADDSDEGGRRSGWISPEGFGV
ncbi:hypothetical protein NL676_013439 [Syzygium grande]|nr:hypothetical protein NL676_013439 [Syzygium grande]